MRSHRETENRLRAELGRIRPPGEREALERAVALAAEPRPERVAIARRRGRRGLAAVLAAVVATAVLTLTPAGAAVTEWIGHAVDPPPPQPALRDVPSGGSLLVQSPVGPWVVEAGGDRHLLGDYRTSTWSPRGMFVAVAGKRELSAVEPDGDPHWKITTPGRPEGIRWSPSGQRIAYLTEPGTDGLADLQVVAGDGSGARTLAAAVQPVAPAWKPVAEGADSPNELAWVDRYGILRAADVDTGAGLGRAGLGSVPRRLVWAGGERLIAVWPNRIELVPLEGGGRTLLRTGPGTIAGATYSRASDSLVALVESPSHGRVHSQLTMVSDVLSGGRAGQTSEPRRLFSGLGRYSDPVLSPDGSRVQLGWPAADQWLFIPTRRGSRSVETFDGIRHQFEAQRSGELPTVSGWCCG